MSRARALFAVAMLAVLALAAAFRLPRLAQRPMHADEANQAVKSGRLYEKGTYEYDATDHHGPSLYWLTLPSLAISGAKDLAGSEEVAYRIVPVIFGLGLIPLLLLLADGLGRPAVVMAALLTAISTAMVFYSRYYIQETLLVFFTFAALGCGWRYLRTRRLAWILAAGAAVGMMHATKETWILSAAAAVAATALTWAWSRLCDSRPCMAFGGDTVGWAERAPTGHHAHMVGGGRRVPPKRLLIHILAAAATACLVAVALFSMFGKNWHGPWNSICAYTNYFRRGSQHGEHSEAWHYYLQLLFAYRPSKRIFWSEGFIAALALIGAAHALTQRSTAADTSQTTRPVPSSPALLRFLTFYTLLLTVLYSLISYKTPWCALSFLMGMILLAGVGTAAVFRFLLARSAGVTATSGSRWRFGLLSAAAAIGVVAGAGHLGWQAYQLNFNPRYLADARNPYVYAHTPMPLPKLAARLDRLAGQVPGGRDLPIHVVVTDNYWPLPWYLRRFNPERVGYWLDAKAWKQDLDRIAPPAILILSSDADSDDLASRLAGYNGPVYESLRPGVLIAVYVRKDLWPAYLEHIAASD